MKAAAEILDSLPLLHLDDELNGVYEGERRLSLLCVSIVVDVWNEGLIIDY